MEKSTKSGLIIVAACVAIQVGVTVHTSKKMLNMTNGLRGEPKLSTTQHLRRLIKKNLPR